MYTRRVTAVVSNWIRHRYDEDRRKVRHGYGKDTTPKDVTQRTLVILVKLQREIAEFYHEHGHLNSRKVKYLVERNCFRTAC